MFRHLTPKTALTALLPAALAITSTATWAQDNANENVRPGIVLYKASKDINFNQRSALNAMLSSQGLKNQKHLNRTGISIATFNLKGKEKAIAQKLMRSGLVEFAEPDYIVEPAVQPNDPSYSSQWHHNNINSPQAWNVTTGSNNVLVAVCDSGFDTDHPDLAGNLRMDLAYNAQDGSNYVEDFSGHGTGTAGTIGAIGDNNTGVAGVNWNVDIIPVRIAISDTNSSAYISTMAKCIEYAADNGARVVNLSYGGIRYASIDAAAKYLRERNGLLFMSAGNSGNEYPDYPDYTSFVGVGATDSSNKKAYFSDYGNYVDLTAPGVSIRTTYKGGTYVNYSGTSFSSPVAAGVAALMVAANPGITADEIEAGLFSTAVDIGAAGDDNVFGHGLVDAEAAVNYALNLGSYLPPVAEISTSFDSVSFGSSITFSGVTSSDADGDIVSYAWDLGDGTTSREMEVTHTYDAAGIYQVSLTVTDNDGLSHSVSTTVQVTNELPVAIIDDMPTSYNAGDTVMFSATSSYDTDGNIVSFEWDFGNGDTATDELVYYTFNNGGTFNVTLTVIDNAGAISSQTVVIIVVDPNGLNAPDGLNATAQGYTVELSWNDNNDNETAYFIERAIKYRGKTEFIDLRLAAANTTSITDVVPEADTYWYRVTAINSSGNATSESVQVVVSDESSAPQPGSIAPPSELSVSRNGDNLIINWTDNSTNESGFYLERGVKSRGSVQYERIAVLSSDINQVVDDATQLASGAYIYRVQAFNNDEVSAYSNEFQYRHR